MTVSQTLFKQFQKLLEKSQETFAVESVFSIVIGGWIGQLKLLKRRVKCFKEVITKEVFLGVFQNLKNSNFSEHPLKNV